MKRVICAMTMSALGVVLTVVTTSTGAEEGASAKVIMGKLTKGANSANAKLKTALKAEPPAWSEIKSAAASFAEYGPQLPKAEAPKGAQADFVKLADAFATHSKDLEAAAKKDDLAGVNAAFGKINGSCAACHKAHKP